MELSEGNMYICCNTAWSIYMKTKILSLSLTLTLLTAISTFPAEAVSLNIAPSDTGSWSLFQGHTSENQNYYAGTSGFNGSDLYRNYFTFDLTGVTDTVTSAVLQLFTYSIIGSGNLRFTLYDVSATPAALDTTFSGFSGIGLSPFDDLGSGTSYGSGSLAGFLSNTVVSFTLNSDGIAAINAARGSFFSIGGSTNSQIGAPNQALFAFSNSNPNNALVLTTVPEPSSVLGMFGFGIIWRVAFLRRRRSKKLLRCHSSTTQ
jgi:PEP-CTERM motif